MKDAVLKKYIRQNRVSKNGEPGTFYLKLLYSPHPLLKSLRKHIGLSTNNKEEALRNARLILRACSVLGAVFTSKLKILPKPRKKKQEKQPTLWDWAASVPAQKELQNEEKIN